MKFNKKTVLLCGAAVAAFVAMVIYVITSVTGYLASSSWSLIPVVCTVLAVALLFMVIVTEKKQWGFIMDLANYAALVLILISFYYFVVARVALVADVYFIPVNYPASEATAVHISLIGVGLYVLADVLMIIVGFLKKSLPES